MSVCECDERYCTPGGDDKYDKGKNAEMIEAILRDNYTRQIRSSMKLISTYVSMNRQDLIDKHMEKIYAMKKDITDQAWAEAELAEHMCDFNWCERHRVPKPTTYNILGTPIVNGVLLHQEEWVWLHSTPCCDDELARKLAIAIRVNDIQIFTKTVADFNKSLDLLRGLSIISNLLQHQQLSLIDMVIDKISPTSDAPQALRRLASCNVEVFKELCSNWQKCEDRWTGDTHINRCLGEAFATGDLNLVVIYTELERQHYRETLRMLYEDRPKSYKINRAFLDKYSKKGFITACKNNHITVVEYYLKCGWTFKPQDLVDITAAANPDNLQLMACLDAFLPPQ